MAEDAIGAWLDHVSAHLARVMLLPLFPREGALAAAFDAALTRRGGGSANFARHTRAQFVPGADRAGYVERAVPHKKLKELRRLGDDGAVALSITGEPAAVPSALGDFLTLEAAGWKGRAGTAARDHADLRTFVETALAGLAGEGKVEIARLCLDGRAIAAIIVLRSGDTAWTWKIAYDESHAHASPGVQLLLHVTHALLADASIARADSCATPDHPMIDHVWRERLALADRLIGLGPRSRADFAFARVIEAARRTELAAAKAVRDRLRG